MNFKDFKFVSLLTSCILLNVFFLPSGASANTEKQPIIFVHGMLASGDTYSEQINRFKLNGYPPQWLHAFDWNSLAFGRGGASADLDLLIDSVLAITQSKKVYLVGHSAGSGLVYNFCKDSIRASKVEGVVLIGGFKQDTTAGPGGILRTLNIFSEGDLVAKGGSEIPGATNIRLKSEDHYEVATGLSAFDAMFTFMNPTSIPVVDQFVKNEPIILSGKAVSLGNNEALAGGKVMVFQLDPATAQRNAQQPNAIFMVDGKGHWGPFQAERNASYEFVVQGADSSDRPIHYFREPFLKSNANIYLRAIPSSGMLSMMFSGIPSDSFPALAVFSSSKAVISGRDSLSVDGVSLTPTDFFKPGRTTIAMFLYDGNGNKQSDLSGVGLFNMQGVFLAGIDMAFHPSERPIQLVFNDRRLAVRRIPSKEGVVVPVFD